MKTTDERLTLEIQREAERLYEEYNGRPASALEARFREEWWAAAPQMPTATRDINETFGERFKKRLIAEAVKNRDLGAALVGYITGQVLNEAQSHGIDLAAYRLAIAVLVAIIYRAVVDSIQADK